MEKQLFENLDHSSRVMRLRDSCDKVINHGYFKRYNDDDLGELKTDLTETLIKVDSIENEFSDVKSEFKERIDPLKKAIKEMLAKVQLKGEMVKEECYTLYDYDNHKAGIYNRMGELIELRSLSSEEKQKVIQMHKLDGTND